MVRTSSSPSSSFANSREPISYPPTPTIITTTSAPWYPPSVPLGTKLDDVWELVPPPRSRSSPTGSTSHKRPRTGENEGSQLPRQPIDHGLFFPLGTSSSADYAPLSSRRALGRVAPPPRIRPPPPPSTSQPILPIPLGPIGLGISIHPRQSAPHIQPPLPRTAPSMPVVAEPRISARRVGVGAGGGRSSFEGLQYSYGEWAEEAMARKQFEHGLFRAVGHASSDLGQSPPSSHPLLVHWHLEGAPYPPHPQNPLPAIS